jgi:hypothetical protein
MGAAGEQLRGVGESGRQQDGGRWASAGRISGHHERSVLLVPLQCDSTTPSSSADRAREEPGST